MKKIPDLPRGLSSKNSIEPAATASWFPTESVAKQAREGGFKYVSGKMWLGRSATDTADAIGWDDDRHMVTIAGSRSGKGVAAIIPTLCEYPGSILCLDPKGENAYRTAARRGFGKTGIKGMMQEVYVLDPFGVSGVEQEYLATFDPLADLSPGDDRALEKAALISDALVISTNPKDTHFDEAAKHLIEALVLHVISAPDFDGKRTLGTVRTLLRDGDVEGRERFLDDKLSNPRLTPQDKLRLETITAFQVLLYLMAENPSFDGLIAGTASGLNDLGDRERGSVLSTARRNLKFLDAPKMRACLEKSDHTVTLADLKRLKRGMSVYLVLPARLMKNHSRWMRLILNLLVAQMEADRAPPANGKPVLAICDEFAMLGHMPVMENAVGYMAGFDLKIWSILQDLSQLKRDYPNSWETFLGNAGLLQCFGVSDNTTLEFISKRLGETEVIREVSNTSESQSKSTTDLSDFEKVTRTETTGDFSLQNDTRTYSESSQSSENQSRTIQKTALLTPDEIRRLTSRSSGMQIVMLADFRPLYLRRTPYFRDDFFNGKYNDSPQDTPQASISSS